VQSGRTPQTLLWLLVVSLLCAACGAEAARSPRRVSATVARVSRPVSVGANPVELIDPSKFSPGACVAFAPTGAPRHVTVFLDAGHGGPDPGAVGTTESGRTIYEANLTLAVEFDTTAILRAAGFRVVVSRTRDTSVLRLGHGDLAGRVFSAEGSHDDVVARDVCANEGHANLLVGIYFDAGAPNYAGALTGYDAVRPFARENLRFARLLQADVLDAMNAEGWGIPSEGVQSDTGLGSALTSEALAYGHLVLLGPAYGDYVPTPSQMPGALIEPLFITDPFEGSIAASRHGQQVIAEAMAKAIEQYFAQGS
jgi:N-acetylmuramoyl-L-alanine amidase